MLSAATTSAQLLMDALLLGKPVSGLSAIESRPLRRRQQ
jgi:hypothetical protein